MRYLLFILSLPLLLIGCTQQPSDITADLPVTPTLLSLFPPDGSTAYFQGEGNEFASYTVHTTYIDTQHIAQIEDNGGVTLLKVYRITEKAIELVLQEVVEESPAIPTAQQVASLPILETVLQSPLQAGQQFHGWTIVSTTETLTIGDTISQDVLLVVRKEDTTTTRKYFAPHIGLLRTEYEMQEDAFVVTSTLTKIE
ncbi:hypothetical protein [Lysinibacillus piscis]|uniref:Uncharacterized protein n=1 Tax=Lysinibacillus piscis TaxID=2518931 RepID=A0ABQ5NM02_9BACI|nr:hypothetical protein [Lysinibacillus sp. KH24]GLC89121.1 hypothetical protein LYSBPC_22480 [Lysinibacillus sp. KH24]